MMMSTFLNALLMFHFSWYFKLIHMIQRSLKLNQEPPLPQLCLLNLLEMRSMNNLLPSYLFWGSGDNRNLSSTGFVALSYLVTTYNFSSHQCVIFSPSQGKDHNGGWRGYIFFEGEKAIAVKIQVKSCLGKIQILFPVQC